MNLGSFRLWRPKRPWLQWRPAADFSAIGANTKNTRILLASAVALAFAAGSVALPSLADAQPIHGGGGHGGGGQNMGGGYHGGGYHGGAVYRGGGYGGGYGGGGYYGGVCGPMQVVLGLCGPYRY